MLKITSNRIQGSIGSAVLAAILSAAGANAQSNIEVRIESVVVPNFHQHFFPGTAIGDVYPQVVVVRNIGSQDLLFTENPPVFLDGAFPSEFELVQPPLESGNKLSPNGSTAFLVRFKPVTPFANPSAFARIYTNDPDTPLFSLSLRGTTLLPDLAVVVDGVEQTLDSQLTFAPTTVGDSLTRTLMIANVGSAPLTIFSNPQLSGSGAAAFQVTSLATTTIAAGDAVDVQVTFAPTAGGVQSAQLSMTTNDLGMPSGQFRLNLVGTGVAAPQDDADEPNDDGQDDNQADEPQDEFADDGNQDDGGQNDGNNDGGDEANDNAGGEVDGEEFDAEEEEIIDELTEEVIRGGRFLGSPCGAGLGFAPLACMALMIGAGRRGR